MITKIVASKPVRSRDRALNSSLLSNSAFGKPTKPRCYEPSMYEILSWKDNSRHQEQYQSDQFTQNHHNQGQQPVSLRKIMGCKSMPSEQFVRSKNTQNYTINPNFQNISDEARTHQQLKVHTTNTQTHSTQNLLKKSQSFKKIATSTKCIESSKQINTGNVQKQSNNLNNFSKQNQKKGKGQQKEQLKMKKLRKKTVPAYVDPENKPRYMQEKKSAVQKLIQSPQFDQEKFEKIKQDEIKRFKQTSRDLSNTAFLTYFNKPPFQNYGRENKHFSGVLYGDYMYSHNVYPHTGDNHPQKQQTYITALSRAKSAENIRPHPPMTRHLQEKLISGYLTLSQIYPKDNQFASIPIKNQTCLDTLPMFNYVRQDENFKRYSPYVNASENEELFTVEDRYLKKQNIPRYFSNKDEIEGKEITYTKKISPCKRM